MAAINKRKILESAQRNLQKGALDKALKDYQTVLEADPRDTNVRLKIGDLELRRGNNDAAISAYLKVADQFQRDGFDAKAVAIYKQVTKIDSKRHDVYVPLADLYQRLGLISEAMVALQTAADAYHRDGRKREALDLLRRMASLDPANVTSRLKVADLLRQEGLEEEALAEYGEAAAELERQGDWEARVGVLERVLELRPERVDALEALATIWFEHGQAARAHPFAARLADADDGRPEVHELLARICSERGDQQAATAAYRRCADVWRTRGDESRAREIMQRYVPAEPFAVESEPFGATTGPTDESPFGVEGDLGADPTTIDGHPLGEVQATRPVAELGAPGPEIELDEEPAEPDSDTAVELDVPAGAQPGPEVSAAAPDTGPGGGEAAAPARPEDVEQLLAEAGVYARYGKHERAIAALDSVLALEPEHIGALMQLGEVCEAAGTGERAAAAFARAARASLAAGDLEQASALRDRVESLDPDAAAAIELPEAEPGAGSADAAAGAAVIDLDEGGAGDVDALETGDLDDIEIDVDEHLVAEAGAPDGAATEDEAAAPDGGGIEIDLDVGGLEGAEAQEALSGAQSDVELPFEEEPAAEEAPAGAEAEAALPLDEDVDLDLDTGALEDEQAEASPDEMSAPPAAREQTWELPPDEGEPAVGEAEAPESAAVPAVPPPPELSASSSQQIQEDFEEAGFYFEQGLFAEAEAIYLRILGRAPNHPGALLRIGEIAVRRGRDPGANLRARRSDIGDATERAGTPAAPPAEARAVEDAEAPDIEPPDPLDLTAPSLDEPADDWAAEPPLGEDTTEDALEPPIQAAAGRAAPPRRREPEVTAPEVTQESPGAAFDLAAELSEALSSEDPAGVTGGAATDEDGFASLFREFKRGVSQTLGDGDVETHFDLGIAYREMGLYEDAIGEFRYALGAPQRRLDALQMMGLCALDLDRAQDAVGHLEQALASPDVPGEREAPLRYDLGRAYAAQGDIERALDALRRVAELDPGFQDVGERIAALERGEPAPPSAAAGETFESFDDLVAEAADEEGAEDAAPEPEPERFESFEDVVADGEDAGSEAAQAAEESEATSAGAAPDDVEAETEAAFVEATLEADAVVEPEPEPESEPEPAESAPAPTRRRRRVSFV